MPEHKKSRLKNHDLITEPNISPSAAVSLFVPKSSYFVDRVCGINNLNLVIPKILSFTNLTSLVKVE